MLNEIAVDGHKWTFSQACDSCVATNEFYSNWLDCNRDYVAVYIDYFQRCVSFNPFSDGSASEIIVSSIDFGAFNVPPPRALNEDDRFTYECLYIAEKLLTALKDTIGLTYES